MRCRVSEARELPLRVPAAAAEIDPALLSKIENGRRPSTQAQLTALAKFFKVPFEPLEARRLAEEMEKWHGDNPVFAEATAILREESGEYRVNNVSAAVSKRAKPVNKPKNGVER